jgi:hypothetical protein
MMMRRRMKLRLRLRLRMKMRMRGMKLIRKVMIKLRF